MSRNFGPTKGPTYSYAFISIPFQASKRDRKEKEQSYREGGGVGVLLGPYGGVCGSVKSSKP